MSDMIPFTDSQRLSAESFAWGTIKWLVSGKLSPGAAQMLGICHILPGQANPLHYHPNCEELLYVLSGTCRHSYDGQWVALGPGMTIRIPAGVRHNLHNDGGETLTCIIAF